jgi:hypothetical protein
LTKRQPKTPAAIKSKPHYRVTLDTTKNDRTGFSQHELLHSLSSNDGAMVYYACPMIFEKAELYEPDPSLDALQLADMASCPGSFGDNSKHYIYFDQKTAQPIWCSDPVHGRSISAATFAAKIASEVRKVEAGQGGEKVLELLTLIKERKVDADNKVEATKSGLALVSDSLTVVQFVPSTQDVT